METYVVPFIVILVAHAGFVFFQVIKKGPSQYDDLLDIHLSNLNSSMRLREILKHKQNGSGKEFCCKEILRVAIVWATRLRIIGFIPLLIYLLFFIFLLGKPILKKDVANIDLVTSIFMISAVSIQVVYILLKIHSNIADLLKHFHNRYINSAPLKILLDIEPLW